MAINRHVVKRSLNAKTKSFIANNLDSIEEFLEPAVQGFGDEIRKLEGPRGRVLELSFQEARTSWEKFFWAALGRHWIVADLSLEIAVRRAEEDLMSLSNVLETVVVLERLAAADSITHPISIQVEDREIIASEELDDLITLDPTEDVDPTEEVDLEHPRIMLPLAKEGSLGAVPMDHMRAAGPEETTVVDGIRGRPKF